MKGFLDFIREQGVVGLAIGFILGGSAKEVVTSLVEDIINPLLGVLLGRTSTLTTAVVYIGPVKLGVGSFFATLLDFLIVAAVVYYVFKGLKLDKIDKKKK